MSKINIEDIEKEVIKVISESLNLDIQKITRESSFNDFDLDSLSRMEILIDLEDKFDIKIPDGEAEKFQSVKDVIEYIEKKSSSS